MSTEGLATRDEGACGAPGGGHAGKEARPAGRIPAKGNARPEPAPTGGWRARLLLVPAVLSAWLVGAHFLRTGRLGIVAACALFPLLFLIRESWVRRVALVFLFHGAGLWLFTALRTAGSRRAAGEPLLLMVLILGGVSLFALLAALLFWAPALRRRFSAAAESAGLSSGAFFLTSGLVLVLHAKAPSGMLLLDRFLPAGGVLEALLLGAYAAFVAGRMVDRKAQPAWRKRVWTILSLVVLGQFALGLAGWERFLLNPEKIHPPVPALIVAAPLFRGEGLFMPILFGATLLLVGPAWCSHLCYIGAWDLRASTSRKRPVDLPAWTKSLRWGLLVSVAGGALLLRFLGVPGWAAASAGVAFGAAGVVLMVLWSRKTGTMAHCTVFCPIGLLANLGGKLSPFRLKIGALCTDCNACMPVCRYGALTLKDIGARRAGFTCTLCGDCLSRCKDGQIGYGFPGLSAQRARSLFLLLAVSVHAVFLGVTML